MWTKQFLLVVGALCMYQVVAEEIYVAEIMVESNVTLTSESILASWSSSMDLTVNGAVVRIKSSELVAECLVVGEEYSCNCSTGYAWSNEVCYNYGCCTEATCLKNVSQATSICVPKTNVVINGLVEKSPIANLNGVLLTHFQKLNGLNGNPTSSSVSSSTAYSFEVNVSVPLNTSKLQEILDGLTVALTSPPIFVNTKGMVDIVAPIGEVNYTSSQSLECTFDEPSDHAGWNLTRGLERFELNNGLLTEIINKCPSVDCVSYVKVNLKSVTGVWAGVYECGFTIGRVRHTASAELKVALLPDVITMTYEPLIAECADKTATSTVTVTATIPKPTRIYNITWENGKTKPREKTVIDKEKYVYKASINCASASHLVIVKFENNNTQETSKKVAIPVLLATESACQKESLDDYDWPKTPSNTTVENPKCPEGRVGFRSRYCNTSAQWEGVVSKCVSAELGKVANAAENFLNGLGATQEVAKNIFEGLKNSSGSSSDVSVDTLADIDASIGIFGVMAKATKNVDLEEDVLPDVVDAASNMVNSSWDGVDPKVTHQMSSSYLENVETLVKNIKINTSEGFNSTNLELRFCSSDDCSISVFGIDVNLNKTNGTMKTMGVKNLMEKLKNDKFPGRNRSSILLSATLVGNNDSDIKIKMFFPDEQPTATERLCVFWDTNKTDWSSEGCIANITDDNQTLCECNHLTSFSILMSKSANVKDSSILDMITNIGLGVSIFSLLIFLFVESLVWSAVTKTNLSHFRHTAVVNIAVFRLLADCSFLASTEPKKLSDTWCFTFTVCKHLFYLTMFCWMLCLSVMLVHQLIFVFSPVRKRVFMYLSSIVGYVVPIALVGTSYVYYKYKEQDYYDRKSCWLTYVRLLEGSIHAFLLPVGTIILSNLFSMVVVIVTLVKTSVPDSSKSDDKDTAKSILKVIVFLAPIFGVTWIIGFALYILEENNPLYEVAEYAFVILNSFQGLFILLTGCVGEQKVRQEVVRIIMAKTGRDTDSTKKLTNSSTTLYTKDK